VIIVRSVSRRGTHVLCTWWESGGRGGSRLDNDAGKLFKQHGKAIFRLPFSPVPSPSFLNPFQRVPYSVWGWNTLGVPRCRTRQSAIKARHSRRMILHTANMSAFVDPSIECLQIRKWMPPHAAARDGSSPASSAENREPAGAVPEGAQTRHPTRRCCACGAPTTPPSAPWWVQLPRTP
jgi:hypothetical protein